MKLSYNLPYYFMIERHALCRLSNVLKNEKFNTEKILLLSDNTVFNLYGKELIDNLNSFTFYKKIISNNSIKEAMKIASFVIENEVTCIIGAGGGRVLDVAKYVSYITKIQCLSIPTTIANDGISSPIAVLKDKDNKSKSLGSKVPDGIIIDIDILRKSPIDLIKAGIGDCLSNITSVYDWDLAQKKKKDKVNYFSKILSLNAINSLMANSIEDIKSIEFIKLLAESIILSGMSMEIAGSSRPCSGAEHLFSHAIDKYTDLNNYHGIQVALGSVITAYIQGQDYLKMIDFLRKYNIDIYPPNLGITEDIFIECITRAKTMRSDRYTVLDTLILESDTLRKIYNDICKETAKDERVNISSRTWN